MATYQIQVVVSILDGSSTVRTETATLTGTISEQFWGGMKVAAGASDVTLTLGLLTDPDVVIVIGGEGISYKIDGTGTDSVGADGVSVISDDDAGLGIDEILLSNSSASEKDVVVIAFES